MSEAREVDAAQAESANAESEPFEVPDQIDDNTFDDLFGDDQPTEPDETGEPQPEANAQPEPDANVELDAVALARQYREVKHGEDRNLIQDTVRSTIEGMQGGQTPEQAVKTGLDQLKENNPNMSEDELKWMANSVEDVLSRSPVVQQMQHLHQRINRVEQEHSRNAQERVKGSYDQHLDGLLDKANVTDAFERKAMKAVVTQEGLSRFGDNFSHQTATQVFRDINNERRQEAHAQRQQYVETKGQQQKATPPVTHSQSTSSASENIMAGLKDPKNKRWGFRGDDFKKAVGWLAEKGDDALG
jgi:hypothetical protein